MKSYCRTCTARYFPDLKYADICLKCPWCRGICNCKPCLRHESHASSPQYTEEQKSALAQLALEYIREPLSDLLSVEEAEACAAGYSRLEDVPQSMIDGERILCNVCATSIPNLHFTCDQLGCGWDICPQCALTDRTWRGEANRLGGEAAQGISGTGGGALATHVCQNSTFHMDSLPPLAARRFIDNDSLSIIRKIVTEGGTSSGSLEDWSRLISSSFKPNPAFSSLLASDPAPFPPADETSSLAVEHQKLRRDYLDPKVRQDGFVELWGHWIRLQDVRCATWVQPGDRSLPSRSREEDFLFSPHVTSLDYQHPDFSQYLLIFLERWRARQPVIVRGVTSPRILF